MLTQTIGIVHYFWLAATLWTFAVNTRSFNTQFIACCYICILAIACIESCIVLLQWLHISPVRNAFFSCTGTWDNPNVTAFFLAMSLYAFGQVFPYEKKGKIRFAVLALLIIAIILLQCRTAWIVTAVILWFIYGSRSNFLFKKTTAVGIFIVFVLLIAFCFKHSSSTGRIYIWQRSVALAFEKPLTGQGFGSFEKEYNRFIAREPLPGNDHVNMPYNDLVEMAVEGGLPAVLLWLGFILTVWQYNHKRKSPVLPLVVFVIIQLTNFGFQAIPAFALFLLYISLGNLPEETIKSIRMHSSYRVWAAALCITTTGILILLHQCSVGKAFWEKNRVVHTYGTRQIVQEMHELSPILTGYASYHEQYGDALMQMRNYKAAQEQFRASLQYSSRPELMMKCGYCCQQQNQYDSSERYYTMVLNMQPYLLMPHMALLKLYQQKEDKAKMLKKAREILNKPIKIQNKQATEMKAYAARILATAYTQNQ
jgi:O-antigen ligase